MTTHSTLSPTPYVQTEAVEATTSTAATAALAVATVAAGLIAGLFYAYACSVLPGLHGTDDRTFVQGMRQINVAIINPVFMLTFLGAPVAAGVAMLLNLHRRPAAWVIAGFVLLLAMVIITAAINVPLNNALAAPGDNYAHLRHAFETAWVRWNIVRALAATAGFGCLVVGCLFRR